MRIHWNASPTDAEGDRSRPLVRPAAGLSPSPHAEPTILSDPRNTPRVYYGYWLIGAAFVAQFVSVGVQNYVTGPFMTPMIDEFGWTRAEYTLPRTLGQLVMAAVGFAIGAHIDRRGARPFMLAGTLILTCALFSLSLTPNLAFWIAVNGLVLTVGAALIGNLVVNVTLAKWFVELRGRAVALSAMGVSFAGVVLTPAVTWAIDAWGWRAAWQALAVMTALLVSPVALIMRRAPEDFGWIPDGRAASDGSSGSAEADFANSLTRREALRTLTFWLLVLAFGLMVLNIPVMLIQTVPFLEDEGYGRLTGAWMILTASLPAMLAKPIWGYFIDKAEARPLASGCAALTALASVWIVVAAVRSSPLQLGIGYLLLGIGWGGMIPIQEVIWARFFGRRYLGAVRSAALPFTLVLSASAPLAASRYHDVVGNYYGALLGVGACALASALIIVTVPDPGIRT